MNNKLMEFEKKNKSEKDQKKKNCEHPLRVD